MATAKKSVLITGCSQGGLGDALSRAFHEQGFRVFASARNPSKMAHFADLGIETVVLDVESKESIEAAVKKISDLTGGTLDVLVNNSGIAYMVPIADADLDRVHKMFSVNVISNIAMIQSFLPLLQKAAPGSMVVNNSSIASVMSLPMQGIYSATKAALSAMGEALRIELEPFGIKVVDLKTGAVKSGFFDNHAKASSPEGVAKLPENSHYELARDILEERMSGTEVMKKAADPDVWAAQIVSDLTRRNPPAHIWRGGSALIAWFLKGFLPVTATDSAAKQMGGMDVFAQRLKAQENKP